MIIIGYLSETKQVSNASFYVALVMMLHESNRTATKTGYDLDPVIEREQDKV